jgi:Trypsin-like peptidase domain
MGSMSGAEQFQKLSVAEKAIYLKTHQHMVRFARDHAVPIIFAPPLRIGGLVNGATGCVLQLSSGAFVVTASHVLDGYEKRVRDGEELNWQVGNLPPYDPLPRIAWRDKERDIVFLRLSDDEVRRVGPCIIPVPPQWPPSAPKKDQFVLVAGYPKALREVDQPSGWIGAGPYSAMFRVTTRGEDYCTCQIEHKDLVSFDGGPLPEPGTDMGGLSGGPVLFLGAIDYPVVGVVTDHCHIDLAHFEILRIATLQNVTIQ